MRLVRILTVLVVIGAGLTAASSPAPGAVACLGRVPTLLGTMGDDTIIGTDGDDVIAGLGGDDLLDGRGGNDRICGGSGDDTILGGSGDDILAGGGGADSILGGGGNDRLSGGAGSDLLVGGPGDDVVRGGKGEDTCDGETQAGCEHATAIWAPAPGTTWQWQLTGGVDVSVDAVMFDVDLFDVPASTVAGLVAGGRVPVCYFSAGSWEDWRPDAGLFPDEVKGRSNGWPGELWLDIRRLDVLGPILEARLDLCRDKGFVGVEADNVDGYSNSTGFPLTAADQLVFNRWLADAAHARGLAIGLKNDVEQAAALEPWFDFAVNEECFRYGECELLVPFIAAGKAVFHVEYNQPADEFCPTTVGLGFSSMRKKLNLAAWREYCPAG